MDNGNPSVLRDNPRKSEIFERFRFKRKEIKATGDVKMLDKLEKRKKAKTTPIINHYKKSPNLQYYEWGWKKSFDVISSELLVRYITEETDGEKCWMLSDTNVPFVYIWYSKDGWFLLRQILDIFTPNFLKTGDYYKRLLMRTRISPSDELFGCCISRVKTNKAGSLWKQLEQCGVSNFQWCVCCKHKSLLESGRCNNIDLINLQSTRKFIISEDYPCKKVLPLLDAIVTLTKSNKRRRALTDSDKQKVVMAQKCKCGKCDKYLDYSEGYEVHHMFKLSEGGSNRSVNLLALCPSCHRVFSELERNRPFTPFSNTT